MPGRPPVPPSPPRAVLPCPPAVSLSGSPSATSRTARLLRHLDARLTAQGHDVVPLDIRTLPAGLQQPNRPIQACVELGVHRHDLENHSTQGGELQNVAQQSTEHRRTTEPLPEDGLLHDEAERDIRPR